MTTAIKRRRGTTSQHSTFTGLEGELTIDTTKDTVVVHDGATAGGFPLAKETNPILNGNVTTTGLNFDSNTFVINTVSKRIGINTASPLSGIDVIGSTNSAGVAKYNILSRSTEAFDASPQTGLAFAHIFNSSGTYSISAGINSAKENSTSGERASNLTFHTSDNSTSMVEQMRITSAGNVGVGTASPTSKLTVNGSFNVTGGATLGDASGDALTINSSAVSIPNGLNFDSNTFVIDATNNNVGIGASPSSNSRLHVLSSGTAFSTSAGTTAVFQRSGASFNGCNVAIIAGNGGDSNIHFGDTDAQDVGAINYSHGSNYMAFNTNSSERMRIDSSGNVGIGTSSPSNKLVISNAGAAGVEINPTLRSGVANSGGSILVYNRSGAAFLPLEIDALDVRFDTSGTERMRLDSSGNLGLGVTPSAWSSSWRSMDVGASTSVVSYLGTVPNSSIIANNYYHNGTSYIYKNTGYASNYAQGSGAHVWNIAASGTAGNAITFTQAMTLNSSGNLLVGTTATTNFIDRVRVVGDTNGVDLGGTSSTGAVRVRGSDTGAALIDFTKLSQDPNSSPYYQGRIFYSFNTNYMTFATSGAERLRIDSSGNLGLGVTPSVGNFVLLQTQRTAITGGANDRSEIAYNYYRTSGVDTYIGTDYASRYRQINGQHIWYYAPSGTAGTTATFTQAMTLDSSGNLLVGKTASAIATVGFEVGAAGTVSSTMASSTGSQSTFNVYSTGAGAYRFYVGMNGVINATSIVISAISDERLKENIKDIDTGINTIMALKPRRFDWKDGKGQDKKNVAGFIAQEFETVFPECVSTTKAGEDGVEYKNINHETLIPTLVKAIQELKAEVDSLKAQLNK